MKNGSSKQINRTPIATGVKAQRYRTIYGMHRYFARRPHNLFEHLVSHYSNPGDVVLDPFFGGGVTLVESMLSARRAIGFDINPMAGFITRMEVEDVTTELISKAMKDLVKRSEKFIKELFSTTCPTCFKSAHASWIEVSAKHECVGCGRNFLVSEATKAGIGAWSCPTCKVNNRISVTSHTNEEPVLIMVNCKCGFNGHKMADDGDRSHFERMVPLLSSKAAKGLWLPDAKIPVCNMERESALHKKGISLFRQLFSSRTLLAWAYIREEISQEANPENQKWLWFIFSAALRYSNRMVTRNPGWRGDKPLEWAKPGYWLPPVYLEVDPLEQMLARAKSIIRAKGKAEGCPARGLRVGSPENVVKFEADFSIQTRSSTEIPLPDESVDLILTDPPYGSYVHYSDLTNFWAIWLPAAIGTGLGQTMDAAEEAVIARKSFPGAKTAGDYQRLLQSVFFEMFRVLKPGNYMVLTFNNREPRSWFALLSAADQAGFTLPKDGVIFQDGIKEYEHTSQSRRVGSVIGDFVYSFYKPKVAKKRIHSGRVPSSADIESELIRLCREELSKGPLAPRDLFTKIYLQMQPVFVDYLHQAGPQNHEKLLAVADEIVFLDSHRKEKLLEYFDFKNQKWQLKQ